VKKEKKSVLIKYNGIKNMEKLLGIVVLGLLLSNFANANLLEFEK